MFKKGLPISFIAPMIIVPIIILYNLFLKAKITELFGNTTGNGILIGLIIILAALILLDSFSMIFKSFSDPFLGNGRKAEKIKRTGYPAVATVLLLGENSKGGTVTINDQPLLNIKLKIEQAKKTPYEISFDTVIPRSAIPQFQPGAMLPVKIDPENPKIVVIDDNMLNNIIITNKDEKITDDDKNLINTEGINATAKLIKLEDTGKSEDFKPIAKYVWEITISENNKYNITNEIPISANNVEEIKSLLNKSFTAKVHPNNQNIIKVNFSS